MRCCAVNKIYERDSSTRMQHSSMWLSIQRSITVITTTRVIPASGPREILSRGCVLYGLTLLRNGDFAEPRVWVIQGSRGIVEYENNFTANNVELTLPRGHEHPVGSRIRIWRSYIYPLWQGSFVCWDGKYRITFRFIIFRILLNVLLRLIVMRRYGGTGCSIRSVRRVFCGCIFDDHRVYSWRISRGKTGCRHCQRAVYVSWVALLERLDRMG